jgi:hypothetical protein
MDFEGYAITITLQIRNWPHRTVLHQKRAPLVQERADLPPYRSIPPTVRQQAPQVLGWQLP